MSEGDASADRAVSAVANPGTPLGGEARIPGDKSISHRALLLGLLAEGESRIAGLLEGEDTLATTRAVAALGARVERDGPGAWRVTGGGTGAFREPEDIIDCGNSGTLARLLTGILAACPVTATLTGDASLRSRPMERVFAPMREIGAGITGREGGCLPAVIRGAERPLPIDWTLEIPSAQVKSAILLAGLQMPGETRVTEPVASRDHTERMLRRMGAPVESSRGAGDCRVHTIRGGIDLRPLEIEVPGDPSSAALVVAAVLAAAGSEVSLPGIGTNPLRSGFYQTIREMGAGLETVPVGGEEEPVGDLHVRQGPLRGVLVPAGRAASMIDEYPALAVVAAFAEGETVMEGLGELRAKESDRLSALVGGLTACGVRARVEEDRLVVVGTGRPPAGGASVRACGDHRIAMAFLALGLGAEAPVEIDDIRSVATSFPGYVGLMRGLGARIDTAAA